MTTRYAHSEGNGIPNGETTEGRLTSFVGDAIEEADASGVVVGLRGDVNSTTAAALAIIALGRERVSGLVVATDDEAAENADAVADWLGIESRRVDVESLVDRVVTTMTTEATEREADGLDATARTVTDPVEHRRRVPDAVAVVAEQVRATALRFEATTRDRLVVGTETRTDLVLARRSANAGADLRLLGDLYETEVGALARRLGVPEHLRPDVANGDEETRRLDGHAISRETRDDVLYHLVDEDMGIERTAAEVDVDPAVVRAYAADHRDARRDGREASTPGSDDPREAEFFHDLELRFETATRSESGGGSAGS